MKQKTTEQLREDFDRAALIAQANETAEPLLEHELDELFDKLDVDGGGSWKAMMRQLTPKILYSMLYKAHCEGSKVPC